MDTDTYASSSAPATGWVGWIVFAAVMMVITGGMNAIQGLAALFRDEAYWLTFSGDVVAFDVTSWGWIHLIFGILLIVVGVMMTRGSTVARVLGIVVVALNLLAQFGWSTLFPFWALIAIALNIIIIYALVMHGGELAQ